MTYDLIEKKGLVKGHLYGNWHWQTRCQINVQN